MIPLAWEVDPLQTSDCKGTASFPLFSLFRVAGLERTFVFDIFRFTDIVLTNGLHSSNGRIE